MKRTRAEAAANSYSGNDAMLAETYWDLFPTGIGPGSGGPLTATERHHLLTQYRPEIESCAPLLFTLGDQMRLTECANAVAFGVKHSTPAIEELRSLEADPKTHCHSQSAIVAARWEVQG